MADTVLDSNAETANSQTMRRSGPFWLDQNIAVFFALDASANLQAYRTTDAFVSAPSVADAQTSTVRSFACVFEQEIVGNTGPLVHVVWQTSTSSFRYRAYNISTGAWVGSSVEIFNSYNQNALNNLGNRTGLSMSKSGDLIAVGHNNTAADNIAYLSTDGGASWGVITDLYQNENGGTGHPGSANAVGCYCNTGDPDDIAFLIVENTVASATFDLTVAVWDASGATWNRTTSGVVIGPSISDETACQWGACTRLSDGHVLFAGWNDVDNAAADLVTVDFLIDSVASPTITAKTTILSNQAECGMADIEIDHATGTVYVTYARGGTWTATQTVYYRISTDGMSTWSAEQTMQADAADDHRALSAGYSGLAGGRFMPVWFDDDDADIFCNLDNAVLLAPLGGGHLIGGRLVNHSALVGGKLVA